MILSRKYTDESGSTRVSRVMFGVSPNIRNTLFVLHPLVSKSQMVENPRRDGSDSTRDAYAPLNQPHRSG
jgi:hypothetical protein